MKKHHTENIISILNNIMCELKIKDGESIFINHNDSSELSITYKRFDGYTQILIYDELG